MFPKLKTGRVDVAVTTVLLARKNADFIVDQILPMCPVSKETGLIGSIGNSHLRLYKSDRGVYDTSSHRMEFKYSLDKDYRVEFHDLEIYLPDRIINDADLPFNPRRDASFSLDQAMTLEREFALAKVMQSTTVITNNQTLVGGDKFSDYANSNPEVVIEEARDSVFDLSGMEANSVVMSRSVANVLKAHPFFLDLAKRNAGGNVSNLNLSTFIELFKSFFEIKNVFIGKSKYISSKEGQTETFANVWSDDMTFFYVPDAPSLMSPSFGYSFQMPAARKRVDIRRHESDLGDVLRNMHGYDDQILQAEAAYLLKSVL